MRADVDVDVIQSYAGPVAARLPRATARQVRLSTRVLTAPSAASPPTDTCSRLRGTADDVRIVTEKGPTAGRVMFVDREVWEMAGDGSRKLMLYPGSHDVPKYSDTLFIIFEFVYNSVR